jgi:endonuclease-3
MATPNRVLTQILAHVGSRPDSLAVTVEGRTGNPFRVLVATILSLRARDEVTAQIAPALLAEAPTPEALSTMPLRRIQSLIRRGSFYRTKALHLREISKQLVERHGGRVPDTVEELVALKGVGRKSANLVLNLAFGKLAVCVDTHVHRVSNRLGWVRTRRPAETEQELMRVLPKTAWIPLNGGLIAFGRTVCLPVAPKCGECPVSHACARVGV